MKKSTIAVLMLLSFITINAQNTDENTISNNGKNEIKINSVMLLAGAFEGVYERNLNEETSLGISFFTPFDEEIDINYYVSPYYRVFFGQKYAAGFFLEGFAMLNSIEREFAINNNGNFGYEERTVTDFALGFGVGGKWLTSGGFVFEISGGLGRNLFENDFDETNLVGKFGFNLGYRF